MDEKQRSHLAEVEGAAGDRGAPLVAASRPAAGIGSRAVVLVDGISDQRALEALAERRGRNPDRYARLLVAALDLTQVPRPLDLVLAHAEPRRLGARDGDAVAVAPPNVTSSGSSVRS